MGWREAHTGDMHMNVVSTAGRGLVAGAVGTAAMDTLLYWRYRRTGGESGFAAWESSAGLSSWDDAPAPAYVGKRIYEALSGRELPPDRARLVNNVMHWAYGIGNAVPYGLVARRLERPRVRYGLPFGATVWGSGYVILPLMGLYQPIWEYDAKTLANDFSAHLVYGLGTAAAFQALSRRT